MTHSVADLIPQLPIDEQSILLPLCTMGGPQDDIPATIRFVMDGSVPAYDYAIDQNVLLAVGHATGQVFLDGRILTIDQAFEFTAMFLRALTSANRGAGLVSLRMTRPGSHGAPDETVIVNIPNRLERAGLIVEALAAARRYARGEGLA